jgi:hypothetical protein
VESIYEVYSLINHSKKEKTIMKRVLFLAMAIVLASGFAIAKTAETPITSADLTDPRGRGQVKDQAKGVT